MLYYISQSKSSRARAKFTWETDCNKTTTKLNEGKKKCNDEFLPFKPYPSYHKIC